MKVFIKTFGCKVNQYNSELLRENLLLNGGLIAKELKEADALLVNACVVTEKAEKEVLKELRKARNVFITGCLSVSLKEKLKNLDVTYLMEDKELISRILSIDREKLIMNSILNNFTGRTRAFIKVQSGCNQFCSYCIVPYVRGVPKSRMKEEILYEIEQVLRKGYKEIVLTGTQIGLYSYEEAKLSDLVEEILKNFSNLKRLRISSIDPTLIDTKLIELMSKENTALCNHLHIPLQSGSDEILKLMNRKYNTSYFLKLIETLRENVPDISITTDVIVGFPSETREDFRETFKVVELVRFSKVHVFPYSDRKETLSSNMGQKINEILKKQRVKELLEFSDRISYNVRSSYIGKKILVLVERNGIGFSKNYLRVMLDKPEDVNPGDIISTNIKSCDRKYLYG